MFNELTLFLQDTNLATSTLLSHSSLSTWPALAGGFPKLRNHYFISSNKCQVSNKSHSSICVIILCTSILKKASPLSLTSITPLNVWLITKIYEELKQRAYRSNIKMMKQWECCWYFTFFYIFEVRFSLLF